MRFFKPKYKGGADVSPYDYRTFGYVPTEANYSGGERYDPEDIEDQESVGICTAISLTQNARKAMGKKYSADFQYLLQKKFLDQNWNEGSSVFHALKTANKYGLLPSKYWTFTTDKDRKLSYAKYIKKLQAVSDKDIEKLLKKTDKILTRYEKIPVDRDIIANAIDNSSSGILARFVVGNEWWTNPIEPLRFPRTIISGHAVTISNYDGNSYRIANSWGTDWADKGTAYSLFNTFPPTEAWLPTYGEVKEEKEEVKETTKNSKIVAEVKTLLDKIKD